MHLFVHNIGTKRLMKDIDLNEEIQKSVEGKLRCPPFIYSMELIGKSLFLSTETGHIIRLSLPNF